MNVLELYQKKRSDPEEIASKVTSGFKMMSDIGLQSPKVMMAAIVDYITKNNLTGISIHGALDIYPYEFFTDPDVARNQIEYVSWFSNALARKTINAGLATYIPGHYHDLPNLIDKYHEYDAMCALVSPMDEHGWFSFGTDGSLTEALLRKSKQIFLEVNPNMPRCLHGPAVHISQVTALCESDYPLVTLPAPELDETSTTIGNLIAEEIPDGACLQLGIGAIPDAVGLALKGKRNLGIHTEMLTSSMIDLIECGAVDNSMKQIHRGRTVATFTLGSRKIYDYINNNPTVEILPATYVNDPYVICQNNNMISVNAALEIDLYGQVCAESNGTMHVSGTGGQLDYVRGAIKSKGGKSFIAFASTAKNDTISKIAPMLKPGAIVSTTKNEVDYVVTEYGMAKLRGKTASQRAKALISIAHPKFRDELIFSAKKQNLIV